MAPPCLLSLYRACITATPFPDPLIAAVAKITCNEMSNRVTSEAIQLHGGFGFTDEFPVSRLYRGARYGTLGGGTSETLRDLIGKRIMDATETGAELLAYDMMRAPDHGKDVRVARFSRKSPAKTAETHVLKRLSTETNFDPTER